MIIFFERTGGFAGIRMKTTVDTDELPPHEANPLKDMIYNANFFDLPEEMTSHSGADRFYYRLTIQDGSRSHTVEMSGSSVPDDLQPLLQELNQLAHSRR